jgi:hypothetical protein
LDVSVVIVSWNTRELLRDCLASLFRHAGDLAFEAIVVDNASGDGSAEMVEREFPAVRLLRSPVNLGFAAANNRGLALARGRYVLLLNSDTRVLEGALPRCVRFADAHPEAGVVGCRLLNADGSLQPSCFEYPSLGNLLLVLSHLPRLFPRSRWLAKERMGAWPHDSEREVEAVVGAFMLVRREAIAAVGPLDEAFYMYGEEADWCRRMTRAGWRVRFTPEAEIVHLGGASAARAEGLMFRQLQGSTLLFVRKHHARPYYWLACAVTWLFLASRALGWLAAGALRAGGRPRALRRARAAAAALARLTLRGPAGLRVRPPTA